MEGEESHLEVNVRGPGNTQTRWKWDGQEWGLGKNETSAEIDPEWSGPRYT